MAETPKITLTNDPYDDMVIVNKAWYNYTKAENTMQNITPLLYNFRIIEDFYNQLNPNKDSTTVVLTPAVYDNPIFLARWNAFSLY